MAVISFLACLWHLVSTRQQYRQNDPVNYGGPGIRRVRFCQGNLAIKLRGLQGSDIIALGDGVDARLQWQAERFICSGVADCTPRYREKTHDMHNCSFHLEMHQTTEGGNKYWLFCSHSVWLGQMKCNGCFLCANAGV